MFMKTLVVLLAGGLAIAGSAQQSMKTFTSPLGLFRFRYPETLVNCTKRHTTDATRESGIPGVDHPLPDSCAGQEALCAGPGSNGTTLACFAYPKEKFKDKPHFVGAAFFISEIQPARTESECLAGSPDWLVTNSKVEPTKINGITFKAWDIEDNWAGGGQSGPVYRSFHHGKCYELGIQIAISRAEYDPGTFKEFTEQDRSEVDDRLRQALNSFVFLK